MICPPILVFHAELSTVSELFITNKISFKKEGLPSCSDCFILCVRHLGTFVNASHNWYTVSSLPKCLWNITMNRRGNKTVTSICFKSFFSWKFEHKCGFGDLLTFCNIKCMFKSFIFMKQMWIMRYSDIHYIMHMCWMLSFSISMLFTQIM